ncbi:MAG TPA: DUF1992 domain-containing protein [Pyrinomonadaceae bacterium]|nr:DUF1992 domain-containing protein [Pyrinomonadaceae bacterium]
MTLRSVKQQIREAMERGEFDNLPGKGKPLDLEAYFQTPEHLRLAYSVLKSGDFVPEEVQLLKEVESLKAELAATTDEARRKQLGRRIADLRTKVALLLEQNRRAK